MSRKALFPGSFDPITLGHYDIIKRASGLFDTLYVAIGTNTTKPRLFPVELCLDMIRASFMNVPNIEVLSYKILTVDLCRRMGIKYIVRGIRNVSDFEYERSLAQTNGKMLPGLETVFLDSNPEYLPISSTIIREILRNKGDISQFVPAEILPYISEFLKNQDRKKGK